MIDTSQQADHLFLLIGSNPLPNAVAGALLVRENGRITLVHSGGTAVEARRLHSWLRNRNEHLRVDPLVIDESDPADIYQKIALEVRNARVRSVGLHYTGGTKAMAVHSYNAVLEECQAREIRPIFSYLDARRLEFVIDPLAPHEGEKGEKIPVTPDILKLRFGDLISLHGWEQKSGTTPADDRVPAARALANAFSQKDVASAWQAWAESELIGRARNGGSWLKDSKLRSLVIPLPQDSRLESVVDGFRQAFGTAVSDKGFLLESLAGSFGEAKKACQWFHGAWLEEYTAAEMQAADPRLHDVIWNVHALDPKHIDTQFEMDVLALHGYQMFAVSCTTQYRKRDAKSKLLEAYVRSRQLGGDEARAALVCMFDQPHTIERELQANVSRDMRVFGRNELKDLRHHLSEWIEQSSGRN